MLLTYTSMILYTVLTIESLVVNLVYSYTVSRREQFQCVSLPIQTVLYNVICF